MKPDSYSKTVLTIIALLLAVVTLRPLFTPIPAQAQATKAAPAAKHYEYTWATLSSQDVGGRSDFNIPDKLEPLLTKMAGDGWELNGVASGGGGGGYLFIFRK